MRMTCAKKTKDPGRVFLPGVLSVPVLLTTTGEEAKRVLYRKIGF
jgi:hypothetical protein